MAISSETRRAGPFTGNGTQQEFPFAFKVFSADQVKVLTAEKSDGKDVELDSTAYSVTLEADQDSNPGGVVTLSAPLPVGSVLAILSSVPYLQPMTLTNRGGFFPTTLNDSADRAVILAQQNAEALSRCVTVDATDTMTPSELKQKLLDAANNATVVAKGYAESAKASAEAAAGSAQYAAGSAASVDAKGEEQKRRVTEEGDKQVKRLQDEADNELILTGTACGERTWTLQADVAAGTAITIPDNLIYLVGRHHFRVSWNGIVLYPTENFTEIGDSDTRSKTFSLTFPAKAGDVLDVWVGALGKGDVTDAIEAASAAQSSVADLSRRVVYKDQGSAEE